jgi:hypothetical protein
MELLILSAFFAAFISCCGAQALFVHLSFRLKSAFVEQT